MPSPPVPCSIRLVAALLATATGAFPALAAPPQPVSPGERDRLAPVAGPCPTFGVVPSGADLELAVYRLRPESSLEPDGDPVLRWTLPAGATVWTPPADRCLEAGGLYGWAVRERTPGARWSEPLLFSVLPQPAGARPTLSQHAPTASSRQQRALATPAPSTALDPRASTARVHRATTAPVQLRVSGAIEAAAFVGDGAALTSIDWSALDNLPPGFADGTDDVVLYAAGNQLQLDATTFSVVEGAGSDLDADLLDGLQGAAYAQQATTYTKGEVDALLVVDNIDAPLPPAPELLRIEDEPRDPGRRRLAWNLPSSAAAAGFVIHQADFPITEPNKTSAIRRFSGTFHAAVDVYSDSGLQHFRVEAVNVLGEPGPLSDELVLDTTSRLAYTADQRADELWELFAARPIDGESATRVSGDLISFGDVGAAQQPDFQWSPDGRRLAYVADQLTDEVLELFVTSPSGGAQRVSAPLDSGSFLYDYAWSPDGEHLAYRAFDGTRVDLYVVAADGGPALVVTGPLPANVFPNSFRWSPDGSHLAYQKVEGLVELGMFVVPTTGGSAIRVDAGVLDGARLDPVFEWSPDGSRLFVSVDSDPDGKEDALWVLDATGLGATLVSQPLVAGGSIRRVAWSPDGSRLAYTADAETPGVIELFAVPASGGDVSRVNDPLPAGASVDSFRIRWSPDASRISYQSDHRIVGVEELWTAAPSGGGASRVNDALVAGGQVYDHRWSPDGARIAYTADQETLGVGELWVKPLTGGGAARVNAPLPGTADVTPDFQWSPDGTRLAFRVDALVNNRWELFVASAHGGVSTKIGGTPFSFVREFAWFRPGLP